MQDFVHQPQQYACLKNYWEAFPYSNACLKDYWQVFPYSMLCPKTLLKRLRPRFGAFILQWTPEFWNMDEGWRVLGIRPALEARGYWCSNFRASASTWVGVSGLLVAWLLLKSWLWCYIYICYLQGFASSALKDLHPLFEGCAINPASPTPDKVECYILPKVPQSTPCLIWNLKFG